MQRSSSFRPRVAVGAAISLALLLGLHALSLGGAATALAVEVTPSPFIFITPTPVQPGAATPSATTAAAQPGASTSQQISEQIASISAQVTQAMQDPTLSADARVQRINLLALQFNVLVAQWQQQIALDPVLTGATVPATCASAPCVPQPAPSPGAAVRVAPTFVQQNTSVPAAPTPLGTPAAVSPTGLTADQLRGQIAAISQQMTTVSQDPTLTADVRNAQLSALSTQFNQLVFQLQQLGG